MFDRFGPHIFTFAALDGVYDSGRVARGFTSRYVGPAGDSTSDLISVDESPMERASLVLVLGGVDL